MYVYESSISFSIVVGHVGVDSAVELDAFGYTVITLPISKLKIAIINLTFRSETKGGSGRGTKEKREKKRRGGANHFVVVREGDGNVGI